MAAKSIVSKTDNKISVVIPAFNAAKWIECCINSILRQREVDVEVIIIDDGSTDNTMNIVSSYSNLIIKQSQRGGACRARNSGLSLASSQYILFLDADDFIHDHSLYHHYRNLVDKNADISIGQTSILQGDGSVGRKKIPETRSYETLLIDWLRGHYAPPCSVVWRTEMINRIGGWNDQLTRNQDGDVIYRSIVAGARVISTPNAFATYRKSSNPHSITAETSPRKLMDLFFTQKKLLEQLTQNHMLTKNLDEALSHSMHLIERLAIRNSYFREYHKIAAYRKRRGWPVATGSLFHRTTVALLGLDLKESIINKIK